VCATLAPETERKGIRLDVAIDPDLPSHIVGDSVRIRQVLTNLISNAVKFTHQGGVKVQANRLGGAQFELAVQDTGIGIDPRMTRSLFEPFRQADAATTRRYGGTGLGLTIVKQLVELMEGRIDCESRLNAGSRFVVTLPLHPGPPSLDSSQGYLAGKDPAADHGKTATEVRPGMAQHDVRRKVLLAEDHPINREVITRQLAKLGYACDCAEDGEQAWQRLISPEADYSMLLTDCRMPFLDGYELTKQLRDREAKLGLPRLPIIALTASALQGEAERCLALGMDAYLTKPLQIDDLRKTLTELMLRQPSPDITRVASTEGEAAPADSELIYEGLTALCGGDLRKVARLVDIFVTTTAEDLRAMDRAHEAGDHAALRQLAHRLSSACHQLDETEAVARLQAIERLEQADGASLKDTIRDLYALARQHVSSVLSRASEFTRVHV
jgi:CheY-like chemotaxis protein/HPt (histidine-containing phosphotransfer) domain-containing protein